MFAGTDGFDNTVYQKQEMSSNTNTLSIRQDHWDSHKRPRLSSSTSKKHGGFSISNVGVSMSNQRRHKPHKPQHRRPTFAGPIQNVTVNVGREATLECLVNHLDKYKVTAYQLLYHIYPSIINVSVHEYYEIINSLYFPGRMVEGKRSNHSCITSSCYYSQ